MFFNRNYRISERANHKLKVACLGIVLSVSVLLISVLIYIWQKHENPIPKHIKKQINFLIFYPSNASEHSVNKSSFKYNPGSKVFNFIDKYKNVNVTIAEQSTPESFVDMPQAYDKLIESLNEYGSFDSYLGKVFLTHPKELNGQQTAVMSTKGTLLFAHPTNGDLTQDQWKKFFNSLEVI